MIIEKLYQSKIECLDEDAASDIMAGHMGYSNAVYNVKIGESIRIRITLYDFNRNTVVGEEVKLYYDDSLMATGTTNSNGQYTFTKLFVDGGIHKISDGSNSVSVFVGQEPYPVGSIYMSVNSTSPATLFGGTWVQLKDTFLLACGDTYSNGSTGGEETHTLTINEMPKHSHSTDIHVHQNNGGYTSMNRTVWSSGNDSGGVFSAKETGGGLAHNNMPPYLVVYMWKRTA